MNKIIIDCYNDVSGELVTLIVDEYTEINNIEFLLKKKLNLSISKQIKLYIHSDLSYNKTISIFDMKNTNKLIMLYNILESPVKQRNCNDQLNMFFCATNRK